MPRTYDPEFRRLVVELVRAGRPVRVLEAENARLKRLVAKASDSRPAPVLADESR